MTLIQSIAELILHFTNVQKDVACENVKPKMDWDSFQIQTS